MTIMATFLGFYHFIPLGHKWKVCSHKKSPLALKSLVLKPKQNLDSELENQLISKYKISFVLKRCFDLNQKFYLIHIFLAIFAPNNVGHQTFLVKNLF